MPNEEEQPRPQLAEEPPIEDRARFLALEAARIASEDKCEDVVVLDLRGLSSVADYFVLGTGTSDRQMHAVVDHIHGFARQIGERPFRLSNPRDATWILADYIDVVIHLFDVEHREYYDLDGLWGDAPRIVWEAAVGLPEHKDSDHNADDASD